MEQLRGVARKVRFSADVSGTSGEDGAVSTTHIARFEVNGRSVQLQADWPPTIEDGDDVVVAGKIDRGVFVGYACYNSTRKVLDCCGCTGHLVVGTGFLTGGLIGAVIAVVANLPDVTAAMYGAAFALLFAGAGANAIKTARRVLVARKIVSQPL